MPHHDFSAPRRPNYTDEERIQRRYQDIRRFTVKVLERPPVREKKEVHVDPKPGLPRIVLIGTGGTIASYG